jgi:hypothetical protein
LAFFRAPGEGELGKHPCPIRAAFVLQLAALSPEKGAIENGKKAELRPEKAHFPSNSSPCSA